MLMHTIARCLVFLVVVTITGCITSAKATSQNVTSPVIVGPIKAVGGKLFTKPASNNTPVEFSVIVNDVYMVTSNQDSRNNTYTESSRIKENSNKVDVEILKVAPQGSIIKVDRIKAGSLASFWLVSAYQEATLGLFGLCYLPDQSLASETAVANKKNETKKVKNTKEE